MSGKIPYSQLLLIANSVPIHLNYISKDEVFLFANKAAERYWFENNMTLIGKTIKEVMGPEEYQKILPTLKDVLSGKTITHKFPFPKTDGTIGFFENTYIPDIDDEGNVLGFAVSGVDITDIIRSQEALKKSEENFRTLADSMPQIVWSANPDGFVDYYNKNWYDYTGFEPGYLGNERWGDIVHPDDLEGLGLQWADALKKEEPYEHEFRVKKASTGEYRWWLSRARPSRDASGKVIKWYGSNTDIQDLKMLHQNLMTEKEMREKFVSTLTHDMRTPLTSAKMNAQLLIKKLTNEIDKKHAARIVEGVNRADRMIQDLLDVSKVQAEGKLPIKVSLINLNDCTKKVIEDFTQIHGEKFIFSPVNDADGLIDGDAYRRVLENLIGNALKYGDHETPINIKLNIDSKGFLLSVHNYGNPIPPGEQDRLFKPFERMNSAKSEKGWGIGLSLVEGFAVSHGGHATVTSTKEEGTTFKVYFPWQ